MTADVVERNVQRTATRWAFIQGVETVDKTDILGRDCEEGLWHRHPLAAPDQHDFSPEGQRAVSLDEFLAEVQQILQDKALL